MHKIFATRQLRRSETSARSRNRELNGGPPRHEFIPIELAYAERKTKENARAATASGRSTRPPIRNEAGFGRTPLIKAARSCSTIRRPKGAIVGFTRSLSQSLVEKGIRVNAVAPGPIWTPFDSLDLSGQRSREPRGGRADEAHGSTPGRLPPASSFWRRMIHRI